MAWTVTESVRTWATNLYGGEQMIEVKLACISDAGASDHDIVTPFIKGAFLYLLKIVPATGGDIPDAVFDCDIEDENNHHILDTDANAVAPTGGIIPHAGSNSMGVYPPIGDHASAKVSLVCATLGNTKQADFYLYFVK